jgi:hypothetical protein
MKPSSAILTGIVTFLSIIASAQEATQPAVAVTPSTQSATAEPVTAATKAAIPKLSVRLSGQSQMTVPEDRFTVYLRKVEVKITSQEYDDGGIRKIKGTYTLWAGKQQCQTMISVPMEGTYDGVTLKFRVTPEDPRCRSYSYTFIPGKGHDFWMTYSGDRGWEYLDSSN